MVYDTFTPTVMNIYLALPSEKTLLSVSLSNHSRKSAKFLLLYKSSDNASIFLNEMVWSRKSDLRLSMLFLKNYIF